jgi:hypothetical protein
VNIQKLDVSGIQMVKLFLIFEWQQQGSSHSNSITGASFTMLT